jgi:hypothetical protein
MKASSKFRLTKTFSILNGDAHKIARIVKRYGSQIISISHEHKPKGSYDDARTYVVRIIEGTALVDIEVYCDTLDRVIENDRSVVVPSKFVGPERPDFYHRGDSLRAYTTAGRVWLNANMYEYNYNGPERAVSAQYITVIADKIKAAGLTILVA